MVQFVIGFIVGSMFGFTVVALLVACRDDE